MDYERLFLAQLGAIDQTIQFIARRHRLSAEELEELRSSVRVKLLDNDYEVLRKFQGRSSLRTYLTAVITRHFLDDRTARWGKWRPCAQARRQGPVGVLLDRLLNRDGHTFDEAVEIVRTTHQTPISERELAAMSAEFPTRSGRRFVGEEHLANLPGTAAAPSPELGSEEAEEARFERCLATAMAGLPAEDRSILRLRFVQGLRVADIARLTKSDQKALYRRFEQLLARLRRDLEGLGVRSDQALARLEEDSVDVSRFWGGDDRGSQPLRPSTP